MVFCELPVTQLSAFAKDEETTSEYTNNVDAVNDVVSANTVSANDSDNVLVQDDIENHSDIVSDGNLWLKVLDSDEIRYSYSGQYVYIRCDSSHLDDVRVKLIGIKGKTYWNSLSMNKDIYGIHIAEDESAKEITARFYLYDHEDLYEDVKIIINQDVQVSGIQLEKKYRQAGNLFYPYDDIDMFYIVKSDKVPYASLEVVGNNSPYTYITSINTDKRYDGSVTFKLHIGSDETADKVQVVAKACADSSVCETMEFQKAEPVERVDITFDDSVYCIHPAVKFGAFINEVGNRENGYIKVEQENISLNISTRSFIYYREPGETEWNNCSESEKFSWNTGFDTHYEYKMHIELYDPAGVLSEGEDGELDIYFNGKKIEKDNINRNPDFKSYTSVYIPLKPFEGAYTHGISIQPSFSDIFEPGDYVYFNVQENYADGTGYNNFKLSIESEHSTNTYIEDGRLLIGADETASEIIVRATSNDFPERYDECVIKISKEPLRITNAEPAETFDHVTKGMWNYIPFKIEGNAPHNISVSLLSKSGNNLNNYGTKSYFMDDDCLCVYVDEDIKDTEIDVSLYSGYGNFRKKIPIKVVPNVSLNDSKIELEYEPEKLITDNKTYFIDYIEQLLDPQKGNLRIKGYEGEAAPFEVVRDPNEISIFSYKDDPHNYEWEYKDREIGSNKNIFVGLNLRVNREANYTLTREDYKNIKIVLNGKLLDTSSMTNWIYTEDDLEGPKGEYCNKTELIYVRFPIELGYHEHDWVIIPRKEASCDRYGYKSHYYCKICDRYFTSDKNYDSEEIKDIEMWKMSSGCIPKQDHKLEKEWRADNTGHWLQCANCKYRENVIKHTSAGPATDTEDEKCTECQYIITPAKGHVHEAQLVPGYASTCVEEGRYDYYECKVCKHFFEDAECTKEILNTYEWLYDKIIIPFAGHTGGTASCMKKAVCDVCGQEYGELAEHNIITVNEIPATCVENGRAAGRKCQACGVVISGFEEIKAKAHFYDAGRIIKEPTYTEEGQILYTCLNCNDTKLEKIDKLLLPETDEIEISAKEKIDINNIFAKKYPGIKIDKFVSSDKKVASVNKKGIVSGKKGGIVSISAMQKNGKEYDEIASIIIVVKSPKLEKKYSINYLDEKLELGKELKDIPKGKTISWDIAGSKKDVAEIDANGVITAKKNGSVKVVCMIGEGKTAAKLTTKVIVKTPVLSIKDNMKLKAGKKKMVTLKNVDKKAEVKWEVSDKNVLEIPADVKTSKIQIKGVNPGTAVLKASVDGHEYTATIVVE